MNKVQIITFLEETNNLYATRALDKAAAMAQEVLGIAEVADSKYGSIQSHITLARILNTIDKYQGHNTRHEEVLAHLKEAEGLSTAERSIVIDIEILLEYGKLYQNDGDMIKDLDYFSTALQRSEEKDYKKGIVLSKIALCEHYMLESNLNTALRYANESLETLTKNTFIEKELLSAEIYNFLGRIYIKKQDLSKSLKFSSSVLDISRKYKDVEKEITALNNMSVVYAIQTDYKMAMQYLLDTLEKSQKVNYRDQIARCHINIGSVYATLFNYEDALNRYHTVLNEYADIIDDSTLISLYNNIGNLYYNQHDAENARVYFQKSMDKALESNYRAGIAQAQAQLGRAYTDLEQYEIALQKAELAQEMFDELGDVNGRQLNLINLGDIHFHMGHYHKAIRLISQGIVYAKMLKDRDNEVRAYLIMANIYQRLEDYKQAFCYQYIYTTLREDLSKVKRNRQILDMEIKFTIQEKQKEIERLNIELVLKNKVIKQRDKIVQQNEQLRSVNAELEQFAYVTSHDLKEPMRMIKSFTELIHHSLEEHIESDTLEYFEFVQEGITRMNQLLDDLLRYATLGNTSNDFDDVDLNDVVEISKMNLQVLIEETNTQIKYERLPKVNAIHSLLNQLFQNLIGNAIKFRKLDTVPTINITHQETDDEYIVAIKDNGIGIDKEHQKRIFIIFQRLHSRRDYAGTGIGLAICQKVMKKLGGAITIESESEKGSTFFLTFPKNKPDKALKEVAEVIVVEKI